MATYYLPNENGWSEDHGYLYYIRLKVDVSYNASTNKSALTITPQFKGGANGVTHGLVSGFYIKAGGTKKLDVSDGTVYGFYMQTASNWTGLINRSTSAAVTLSYELQHNADGTASLAFELNGQTSAGSVNNSFFGKTATLSLSENRQFTLTISAGTGSTITVKRNGTTLQNGATITYGDVLTISFGASTGYDLLTHTVNGSSFTSGNTHTVTGAVTVASTAAKKTFTLTISAGTGSTITVKRNGTTLQNGATITYGDVLTISFGASTGYDLSTHTVNGTNFNSGGTHTVTGAVTVASTAAKKTFTLTISAGTGSTITVKRNGTTLQNGATISYGDVLTISASAGTGYTLDWLKVNGTSFTSGNTHTVSAAVTVTTSATGRSSIAACSSTADTLGTISISMNRTGTLYHKATVKRGNTVLTTSSAFTVSCSISVPRSWFSGLSTATSFTATVSVQCYTDSGCTTTSGDPVTTTVTIRADSGMKPVLAAGYATAAPYNTGSAAEGINKYVSGYSKATITLDSSKLDMSAAVGATVSSITVTGGGVTATSSPYRTGVLRDTATITVTVTDSRGRSATQTLSVATLAYSKPRLSGIAVIRCDSSGNEDEEGAYYAVTATLTISSLDGANSGTLTANGYTLTSGTRRILGGTLQADRTYSVSIVGSDSLGNTSTVTVTLPGRKWAMRFRPDGEGVGFGMSPQKGDAVEVPENWSYYTGAHRMWGKTVYVAAGTSQTIQLERWRQYLVAPSYGPTWIVQTRETDQTPLVGTAFSAATNSNISCTAAADCSITLQNSTGSSYSFSIMLI